MPSARADPRSKAATARTIMLPPIKNAIFIITGRHLGRGGDYLAGPVTMAGKELAMQGPDLAYRAQNYRDGTTKRIIMFGMFIMTRYDITISIDFVLHTSIFPFFLSLSPQRYDWHV